MKIIETKEWIRQSILEEVIVVKGNVLRISIIGNSICRDIHGRKSLWVVSPAPLLSLSSARLSPKLKRINFHYEHEFIHQKNCIYVLKFRHYCYTPGETKTSIDDDSVFGAEQVQLPESSLSTLFIISLEWVFGPGSV